VLQYISRLRIVCSANATVSGGAFLAAPHAPADKAARRVRSMGRGGEQGTLGRSRRVKKNLKLSQERRRWK
jgi:hypothetical protein